jgi:hypothetical protein
MKKAELKKILMPLIKECIKESLQDTAFLNTIVSEVLQVAGSKALLGESVQLSAPQPKPQTTFKSDLYTEGAKKQKKELDKMKRELTESSKKQFGGVNVFEGVEALSRGGSTSPSPQASQAINSYAPDDAGIDISGLFNQNADIWKKLANT